jgi:hypothetical protein
VLRRNYRNTEIPEDGINECRNASESQSVYYVMYTMQCCIRLVAVNSYFILALIQLPARLCYLQEVMSQCRQVAEPLGNVTGQGGSPWKGWTWTNIPTACRNGTHVIADMMNWQAQALDVTFKVRLSIPQLSACLPVQWPACCLVLSGTNLKMSP